MNLSDDACSLIHKDGTWVAVFPAEGLHTYEMLGRLSELVSVISAVYRRYRGTGGTFKEAFLYAVPDAKQYLVRPSLSRT